MKYTLKEARRLSDSFLEQYEAINNQDISKYEHDARIAYLLLAMEQLDIPFQTQDNQALIKQCEGNALLLKTYLRIASTQNL